MTFADSPELARELSQAIPPPALDMRYFAFAEGTLAEHEVLEKWFISYIELHLTALDNFLNETGENSQDTADACGVLWLLQNLPEETKAAIYCNSHFSDWVFRAFFKLSQIRNDTKNISLYDDFISHVIMIPLLLIPHYQKLGLTFETKAFMPKRLLPFNCDWLLEGESPASCHLSVCAERVKVQFENSEWRWPLQSKMHSISAIPKSVPYSLKQRVILDKTKIEIAEARDLPFDGFNDGRCSPWSGHDDEVVRSLRKSFHMVEVSWPEALLHLQHYARTLVPFIPKETGRHNSTTTNQYFYGHGLDVCIGQEILNLGSIVHESMHCKLRLLMLSRVLYTNSNDDMSFRHPWMEIPRPLRGVLLGAHAFVNVMLLFSRIGDSMPVYRDAAMRSFTELLPQVRTALDTLDDGSWTDAGLKLKNSLREKYHELAG